MLTSVCENSPAWVSGKCHLRSEQLPHTSQWPRDPDYECVSPAAFSILPGRPGFEIQDYTCAPNLKEESGHLYAWKQTA